MKFRACCLALLFVACATAPSDDRLGVDASVISESVEVSYYRVIIRNSSNRPLTIEQVEVQPIGGLHTKGAFINARKVMSPGEIETFNLSTEVDVRDLQRTSETTGGFVGSSTMGRGGKPTARVYVTFRDGRERVAASYKVEL